MNSKVLLVLVCVSILNIEGIKASGIPTTIRLEENNGSTSPDGKALTCSFLLDENRELARLEWWTISDTKLTKIFSLKLGSTPKIHHDYRNILIGSGLNMGKKLSTHWVTLNKNEKQSVDYYECIVYDDKGQIGYKSKSTKLIVKEQLEIFGSGSGGGSGDDGSGEEPCGGNFTGSFGQIVSPNYPSNYPDNSFCEWRVTVEPGQVIIFDFSFIDLEACCTCDNIEIRDGSSEFDELIATVCFSHDTTEFFKTTGNTGYVRFVSDFSITATGFTLFWEAAPPVICGGNLTGSSGIIESPNFPSLYPDYSLCIWTITVDPGSTIYMELLAFDLENCCTCDYVDIRDGETEFDPLLVTFCDPLDGNDTVETSGDSAYIEFRSDLSVTAPGFQLYWEARGLTTAANKLYEFSAAILTDESVDSKAIAFDTVFYNHEDVYSPSTGVFAPPVHGLYFVSTSCLSTPGSNFRVYIRRNQDEILCKGLASDTESTVGTCSVIEEMFPGDKIIVTGDDKFSGVAVGDSHSEFTGYLVKKLDN